MELVASWVPGLAEPVIGPRFARTRWLARDTPLLIQLLAPKGQVAGRAALALGLVLVARAGEAPPGQPPVVGALGSPFEVARSDEMLQRPARIVGPVGGEAEAAARREHAR